MGKVIIKIIVIIKSYNALSVKPTPSSQSKFLKRSEGIINIKRLYRNDKISLGYAIPETLLPDRNTMHGVVVNSCCACSRVAFLCTSDILDRCLCLVEGWGLLKISTRDSNFLPVVSGL